MADQTRPAGLKISLPVLLVFLSLAGVLPLIGLTLYGLHQFDQQARITDEERVIGSARSISANIDRELSSLIAAGGALLTSQSLAENNLAAFYGEAKLAMIYSQANVLLIDPSMQQLINTRVPYGTPLPKSADSESVERVTTSLKMDVSDIFLGRVLKKRVFNVTLPVLENGAIKYLLIVTAEPKRIQPVLDQDWQVPGWHAAVSDRKGIVFATTDPQLDGKQIAAKPLENPRPYKTLKQVEIDGEPSILSVHQSALTGWTTSVWVSHAVLDAPLAPTWRNVYAASLLAIGLSALLAYLFQYPLAQLIRQTLAAASRVGKPGPLPEIRTVLAEGDTIAASLAMVDRELRASQRQAEDGKRLLDTLLEHVPEGITIVGGPDFRVVANSRKAIEMAGRPNEQLAVLATGHADAFGIWYPGGTERPAVEQLPLYRASRFGESISEEYFTVKRPDGSQIMIEVTVNPVRDAQGEIIGAISCWRDVTQRFMAERVIADNEKRLVLALRVSGMAMIDINLVKGVISGLTNGAEHLGLTGEAGESVKTALPRFREAIHPEDRARVAASHARAMTVPGYFSDEFRILRPDGTVAWIETRGETITDDSGKVCRLLGTNVDITARKRADEHLQLVQRELTHRAKNLLTVILGIASQTARRNTSIDDFLTAFSRRVQGLGSSHDLLVKRDWAGVPLQELVEAQLQPFGGVDGKRISAAGPPVSLKVDVLQNLGLALHELATNATKYGALSSPTGTISIEWSVAEVGGEPRLRMSWTERGGPKVKPPAAQGFGHIIIEKSLARVVNGDVKLQFSTKGVVWTLDAPLDAITPAA